MLNDIAYFLIDEGLVTQKGTDIFEEIMPPDPDTVTVLYEYAGRPPNIPCETVERKFQVATRAVDPDAARSKNWKIFNALHPTEPGDKQSLTLDRWGLLYAIDTPSKLKIDENGRTIYVCNYSIVTQKG
jgi:hypothetical protein